MNTKKQEIVSDHQKPQEATPYRQAHTLIEQMENSGVRLSTDEKNLIVNTAFQANSIQPAQQVAKEIQHRHQSTSTPKSSSSISVHLASVKSQTKQLKPPFSRPQKTVR